MLAKFWEGVGSEAAARWFSIVVVPATLFWLGGLLAWGFGTGPLSPALDDGDRLRCLGRSLAGRETYEQIALLVAVTIGVAASAIVVARFEPAVLRLLQGYWPPGLRWLRNRRADTWSRRQQEAKSAFAALQSTPPAQQTFHDHVRHAALDDKLHRQPTNPRDQMATRLGNTLRASEWRPRSFYGLDAAIAWPRLWLLLPKEVRTELQSARAPLDNAVRAWLWSALSIAWTAFTPYALPLAVALCSTAYWATLNPARTYGDLLEAAFDLHRDALYRAMRWRLPSTPEDERKAGALLTYALWRGTPDGTLRYTAPSAAP